MISPYQNFNNFLRLLRWQDWKNVKIAFVLLSILYFQYITHFLGEGASFYINFSLLIILSLSYYGFLFLTNDFFDIDQDIKSGKKKEVQHFDKPDLILIIIALLFFGSLSAALAWKQATLTSTLIFISCYFFAFFYSAPPIRFKERGLWGIVVGSLVLRPACLALLFAGFQIGAFIFDLLLMLVWLEILGLRRIMNHQIEDYQRDIRGGVKTFTTRVGISTIQHLNKIVFLPLEILFLFLTLTLMVFRIHQVVFTIFVYIIIHLIVFFKNREISIEYFSTARPLFYDLYFLFLPLQFAFLVASKQSAWTIPIFVILWQMNLLKNFWAVLMSVISKDK